ncbi:ladderlectin-like [Clinocottus analis]|uniref:ladderlectin-like n=1 Tax=Clinocottus analis TaxID=304258 RepID=UPI0035BF8B83
MAEKSCQKMNANLASVHSLEEDEFVQRMILQENPYNPATWIGGSDCQQDNVWLWSNGKDSAFRNYCENQLQEHGCILSNYRKTTCWVNQDCSLYQAYVCAFTV